jgi:hypothetical protein
MLVAPFFKEAPAETRRFSDSDQAKQERTFRANGKRKLELFKSRLLMNLEESHAVWHLRRMLRTSQSLQKMCKKIASYIRANVA